MNNHISNKFTAIVSSVMLHTLIIVGITLIVFPLYLALIASTHTAEQLMQSPLPLLPGKQLITNYYNILTKPLVATGGVTVAQMLFNSFVMAISIAVGKIILALLSAYAIVFFSFPLRGFCFWLIFLTLLLPVEVRILPTFAVVSRLDLLDSFTGLSLPLIASATATFLFRQFFLTIPKQLFDAARIDGAGPYRFFMDVILPMSKTNIAALFVIMFIYGWNQYLWPLVVTTEGKMNTIVMAMQRLSTVADQIPQWHHIMAIAVLAILPPLIVMLCMQPLFEKALIECEK